MWLLAHMTDFSVSYLFESKIGGIAWAERERKGGVSEGQPPHAIAKSPPSLLDICSYKLGTRVSWLLRTLLNICGFPSKV